MGIIGPRYVPGPEGMESRVPMELKSPPISRTFLMGREERVLSR